MEETDPNYPQVAKKLDEYRRYEEQAKKAEIARDIAAAKSSGLRLKQVVKAPVDYYDKLVAWKGKIMQIKEEDGNTFAQISYYDNQGMTANNFMVLLSGSYDIYEDDSVVVYGRFHHMEDYESQAGYKLSSPYVKGISMKKISPLSPF